MLKTILITGSMGMVVGFTGTILTLFGGGSIRVELLEFAVALLLFLVILVGAYWILVSTPGTSEEIQPKKKTLVRKEVQGLFASISAFQHAQASPSLVSISAGLLDASPRASNPTALAAVPRAAGQGRNGKG